MDTGHSQAPRKDVLPESDTGYTLDRKSGPKAPDYSGPNRTSTSDGPAECKSRDEK